MYRHTAAVFAKHSGKLARCFFVVVFAAYKRIFKGNSSARGCEIIAASGEKSFNVPFFVYGHEGRAHFIVCRVERNGKRYLHFLLGKVVDARHDSAGGKRNVAEADVKALFVVYI